MARRAGRQGADAHALQHGFQIEERRPKQRDAPVRKPEAVIDERIVVELGVEIRVAQFGGARGYPPRCAETGQGIGGLLTEIEKIQEKIHFRVPTSELNDFFFNTIRKAPAPVWGTTNVKFYYLTQTMQKPPAFIAFANHPDGVDNAYRRFLIKNMKEHFNLQGIPIRIFCMKSRRGKSNGDD